MRLKKYLEEKYLLSLPHSVNLADERMAIYINPDHRDMMNFPWDKMRFVADPFKKNLYVWDEEGEIHARVLYYLARKKLIDDANKSIAGPFLTGFCRVSGSKMRMSDTYGKDARGPEWEWLDEYFSNRKEYKFW